MRRNSGIIGERLLVKRQDSENCKVSDLHDVYVNTVTKAWPKPTQLTVNTVTSSTITEGGSATFQIRDSYSEGNIVYWTVNFNGSTNSSDFSATSGQVTLGSGNSTIIVGTAADTVSESTETFYLDYRLNSTSGPIIASSPVVSITNVNLSITTQFIPARPLQTMSYTNSSDSALPYDVYDFNVPNNASGSKRIYIGLKCTHPTSYRNDVCFAGLQILNSAGNSVLRRDIFSVGTESYETVTSRLRNSSAVGFSSISAATSASYTAVALGSSARRFNRATSTGSTYTGMRDGISTGYKTSQTLPAPNSSTIHQVNQGYNTNFLYCETSGAQTNDEYTMRSPNYSFSGGEIIRLCYQLSSGAGSFDIDNTVFLAIA
tara:strand:+ start:141 stop:1265 length:1125 start_codon:yes stop_codon:yes gene_type:complete